MRILLLSDSMALPREEFSAEHACYLEILEKKFETIDFQRLSLGKAILPNLVNQYDRYYRYFNPDIVILHCGIVDCAPRALKKWEQHLLGGLPLLGKVVYKYRKQLRKLRNISYTSQTQFKCLLDHLQSQLGSSLFVISIAPPTSRYRKKVEGILERVEAYNALLQSVNNYVDLSEMPEAFIGSDDYHFNYLGHEFVAQKLEKAIKLVRSK